MNPDLDRLQPYPFEKLRQLFVRSLPPSFRLWFCVRLVNHEEEPGDWTYMLKFLANKHLGIPAQLPLRELGRRLSSIHARSDHRVMDDLRAGGALRRRGD